MSNFALKKPPPTGHDMKNTTQETTLKQQGFHELNKRRAFLQDNSWIKKRPEQERDENYGRVVLNRHNSHDALDRKVNESDEPKARISRHRSDDTLDRISDKNDAVKTFKANTLDNQLTNRSLSTFRPSEATKMKPGSLFSSNTTNTPTSTSATTPVKKKRQSWFPPPPPGYNEISSPGSNRRESTVYPPIPPKPSSPVSSPNLPRRDNRQICPPKPGIYTGTNKPAERTIRSQDLENIVKVATSLQKTDKGEELDNRIKMNKSLSRNQGLDGLFRASHKAEKTEKRAKSLENLVFINSQLEKNGKGNQTRSSFIKENPRTTKNDKGKQDFSGYINADPETNKNIKSSKDLDSLIKVNSIIGKHLQGDQNLDSLIKVTPETNITNQGNQGLENLIKVVPSVNKSCDQGLDELINVSPKAVKTVAGNQDLDKLIKVKPAVLTNNQRNQDLDKYIKVNPAVIRNNQSSQDLDNYIKVKPSALRNIKQDQDLENVTEVNANVSNNNNGGLEGHANGSMDSPNSQSSRTSAYSYEAKKNLSKSLNTGYQENISGKYIQTVYSTSDRSVIERDMCTYCRKPLGTETKMILDELQICCHSTCFKCEICKQSLENLQAGDSIWIYRQTIHCEPCYSKVVATWIQ